MFFTYLNQILTEGIDLVLTVRKEPDGKLAIIVLPRKNGLKDKAQSNIIPLNLLANPQELDQSFFQTITTPLQKASGLLMNMKEFEQGIKNAAKSTASTKKTTSTTSKKEEPKVNVAYGEAVELEKNGKYREAIEKYKESLPHMSGEKKLSVQRKINELSQKAAGPGLFDQEVLPEKVPTPSLESKPQNQTGTAPLFGDMSQQTGNLPSGIQFSADKQNLKQPEVIPGTHGVTASPEPEVVPFNDPSYEYAKYIPEEELTDKTTCHDEIPLSSMVTATKMVHPDEYPDYPNASHFSSTPSYLPF